MNTPVTLTVKVLSDNDLLGHLPKAAALTESQKELIRMISRTAVQEYIREMGRPQHGSSTDRILRLAEVCRVTGLCRSSIYLGMNQGTFPKSVRLGMKSVGWRFSQIEEWLDQCERAKSA